MWFKILSETGENDGCPRIRNNNALVVNDDSAPWPAPSPSRPHLSSTPTFKPVTWPFATDLLMECLGMVNRARTQVGREEAGDAAQI